MKANELSCKDLMIGDWVSYYKPGTELVIGRIKKLNVNKYLDGDDEIEVVDSKGCWMTIPDINELQPIPLTAEILEKNGFEVQDQGGGRKDVWIGFGIDCEGDIEVEFQHNIPTHLKIDGVFKGEYYTSTNIKYVHLLQHALRLCGIDKEIKLED